MQLRFKEPKYDERELLVQRNAMSVSYGVFWVIFVLWGVAAGLLSDSGVWHLPGCFYAFQVCIAAWLVYTVQTISVIWQEWRMGK